MNVTDQQLTHNETIAVIDQVLRQVIWQIQKQSLHTISRPAIALTMPQMMTLVAIHAAGTCRMSELAEVTQQSAGTLTGIVDRLIQDGLVARVRDSDDRRVVQVALTPAGKERLAHAEQACRDDMAHMLRYFSQEQLAQFESLLRRLLSNVTDVPMQTVNAKDCLQKSCRKGQQ